MISSVLSETLVRLRPKSRYTVILFLSLSWLLTPAIQAQFPAHYFTDQEHRTVQDSQTVVLGRLQDDQYYLTEAEAIEMALRNNLDVQVERHSPLLAEWSLEERKSVYDPSTFFNFNWDRQTTPTTSALQGGDSLTEIVTLYEGGYRQEFSTGSSFEFNVTGNRNRTTNFFASLNPAISSGFEALFRQNLLEGFGRIGADYEIEISRNNLDISQEGFRDTTSQIILQVQQTYWDLRLALENIRVQETSLEAAQALLDQNQARFDVGSVARLEVVQSEAEVALREEELVRARYSYRRLQDQLVRLISNYENPNQFPGEIVPADVADPSMVKVDESFEKLLAIAREMRPELQEADLEIENRRVELQSSRNQLRPSLDLIAGYQQFGLGGTRIIRDFSGGFSDPTIIDLIPGGIDDSLNQLFSSDFYGYVLGLNLELPIFNTEARAQNAQAQLAHEQSRFSRRSLEQTVALQIQNALNQIEMNQASLQAGLTAVRAAEERLDSEQARFEVGVGTTRELIEAQRDLVQAESVLVRARTSLMKSQAQLNFAVGRTFESNNIDLNDALSTNVRTPVD